MVLFGSGRCHAGEYHHQCYNSQNWFTVLLAAMSQLTEMRSCSRRSIGSFFSGNAKYVAQFNISYAPWNFRQDDDPGTTTTAVNDFDHREGSTSWGVGRRSWSGIGMHHLLSIHAIFNLGLGTTICVTDIQETRTCIICSQLANNTYPQPEPFPARTSLSGARFPTAMDTKAVLSPLTPPSLVVDTSSDRIVWPSTFDSMLWTLYWSE